MLEQATSGCCGGAAQSQLLRHLRYPQMDMKMQPVSAVSVDIRSNNTGGLVPFVSFAI
jgi:hypothetical protein